MSGPMSWLLLCLFCHRSVAVTRTFHIAAVELDWDYSDSSRLTALHRPQAPRSHGPALYKKAVYVEYTDASFTQTKPRPDWTGLLGPTIRAETFDSVVIHFKNLASRPFSLHGIGVSYGKSSEGVGYEDGTSQSEKADDAVAPGALHTYVWEIPESYGPTESDSPCVTSAYFSQYSPSRDTNAGLVGPILICKPGSLSEDGSQRGMQEHVLLFAVFDESNSHYTQGESEILHTINGYMNFTLPELRLCHRKPVSWHVIGFGTRSDIHAISLEGHSFVVSGHRVTSLPVSALTFLTASIQPGDSGVYTMSCQTPSHPAGGMAALVRVEVCAEEPGKQMRMSGPSDDVEEDEYDDYYESTVLEMSDDSSPIQIRSYGKLRPVTWTHHIAALEVDWEYTPASSKQEGKRALPPIGTRYVKAVYVEFTDSTFRYRKHMDQPGAGILGPVLRGEVGDQFKIVFKNLAHRPYNVYPQGLSSMGSEHPRLTAEQLRDFPIHPNETITYLWRVTPDDAPATSDPRCLTRFYSSSLHPQRDEASGLIGPLLICSKETLDKRGNQIMTDKERFLLFSVFDESLSWYREQNLLKFYGNSSGVEASTPKPLKLGQMHTVNGFVDCLHLSLCLNEVTFWHVLSLGEHTTPLSIFFGGNTFKLDSAYEDTLTLFPTTGETISMVMEKSGHWILAPLDPSLAALGMRASLSVSQCDRVLDGFYEYDYENFMEDSLLDPTVLQPRGIQNRRRPPQSRRNTNETHLPHPKSQDKNVPGRRGEGPFKIIPNRPLTLNPLWPHKPTPRGHSLTSPSTGREVTDVQSNLAKPTDIAPLTVHGDPHNTEQGISWERSARDPNPTSESPPLPSMSQTLTNGESSVPNKSNEAESEATQIETHTEHRLSHPTGTPKNSHPAPSHDSITDPGMRGDWPDLGDTWQLPSVSLNPGEARPTPELRGPMGKTLSQEIRGSPTFPTVTEWLGEVTKEQGTFGGSQGPPHNGETKTEQDNAVGGKSTMDDKASHGDILGVGPRVESVERDSKAERGERVSTGERKKRDTPVESAQPVDYDDYSSADPEDIDLYGEEWDKDPRSLDGDVRSYFIAAVEVTWDYGAGKSPYFVTDTPGVPRSSHGFPWYKKVVFREYLDSRFTEPATRGERDIHLGLLGPYIRAEINDVIIVHFKNMASRPYSFYSNVMSFNGGLEGGVPPQHTHTYTGKVNAQLGPTETGVQCRAWAYTSNIHSDRDLHSGLLGPLLICHPQVLSRSFDYQLSVRDFSLLFMEIDEARSWYLNENLQRHCPGPCTIRGPDPALCPAYCAIHPSDSAFQRTHTFHAINGYVGDSLPGLVMPLQQRVRWHLLGAGSSDIHAAHFHGNSLTYHSHHQRHVTLLSLYPGVFVTLEMVPRKAGLWRVESQVGEHQDYGMTALYLVYDPRCRQPLGLSSGIIKDSQISASGHYGAWEPRLARLDYSGSINAWSVENVNSWIQVDLLTPRLVHAVHTQGARQRLVPLYISQFVVFYSLRGDSWSRYQGNASSSQMVFFGNVDGSSVRENMFDPPLVARFLRLHPTHTGARAALRMELIGCDITSCSLPFGLQSGSLPSHRLSASSHLHSIISSWVPNLARLKQRGRVNAWRPRADSPGEWLQVDIGHRVKVTGLVTQGARSSFSPMFVTRFSLSSSIDGDIWERVKEPGGATQVYQGNRDPDTPIWVTVQPPLITRFLRLHPESWRGGIALRLEVLGCEST
ncbi:coagulation factor VIII isoform X3 [Ascaphus truei]|uniref:coagulation factor VIII isoform X3 n=1 Tax=Ascaphus truei TaxID=8439 RepID=UPI003F5A7C73